MPQEWHPSGICPGTPSIQHQHLWFANRRLQKVCLRQPPSIIMHADWRLANNRRGAKQNMATVDEYLQTWKLKLCTKKSSVGNLPPQHNKNAKHEVKVNHSEILPFCSEPTFLGVMLGRTLMYCRHFELLCKKLTPHVALLRRLAGPGWGAAATTLRIATLAVVHPTTTAVLLSGAAVLIPASLILPSMTPCQLWLDTCVLHQRAIFLSSQASNLLSVVAEVHCL